MKSTKLAFLLSTLFAAGAWAQAPPPPSETTNSEASIGGAINAVLDTSVDSKKAKSGEAVAAHTTETLKSSDNRAIMPKGTKLTGHITQASSRSTGANESMVAIQFDKATLKDGQEVALANFTIQAIAAPASANSSYVNDNERMGSPGMSSPGAAPSNNPSMSGSRGARPDAAPNTQSYPNAGAAAPQSDSQPAPAGPLPASARGVYGIEGMRLATTATNSNEGSVITSSGKSLHLDKGTRLLLVGQPPSGTAAASK